VKTYTVRLYQKIDFDLWNDFVTKAKNATFLFHRNFMEYQEDRFSDYSLIVETENKWVAVLPANKVDNQIFSHQGLTYGGLVYDEKMDADKVRLIWETIFDFLRNQKKTNLIYKPILPFYTQSSSDEMVYFLFKNNAKLYRKDLNLAIDFTKKWSISKSKMKHFRRVSDSDLEIRKEQNFELFWNSVLIPRLEEKHQTKPIHSLDEIQRLAVLFPQNILQYNVYFEDEITAGITLFHFGNGVKSQYGATTILGEKMRALDFLFINLIEDFKKTVAFFDMGTVTESNELGYNSGLLKQKEELGCSVYTQDFYELKL
jgi:hypothetical protein